MVTLRGDCSHCFIPPACYINNSEENAMPDSCLDCGRRADCVFCDLTPEALVAFDGIKTFEVLSFSAKDSPRAVSFWSVRAGFASL